MTADRAEYYSRIAPIIGGALDGKTVAVFNLAAVGLAAERLAQCGVLRWAIAEPAADAFIAQLTAHNTWEERWHFSQLPAGGYTATLEALRAANPDLILGGGTAEQLVTIGLAARQLGKPALLVAFPATGIAQAAVLALMPGDAGREPRDLLRVLGYPALGAAGDHFAWLDANALVAAVARALLLPDDALPGQSLRELFGAGRTAALLGAADWPWEIRYLDLKSCGAAPAVGRLAQQAEQPGHIAIIGCGSLGSVAARDLVEAGAREIMLLDGDTVQAANPVRQFFSTAQVGENKAAALAHNLARLGAVRVVYHEGMARDEAQLGAWLDECKPAAALVATGTDDDYLIAEALRQRGIPHVVGRCYPRARYFEALIVAGGPCFNCLRGHLYTGPRPAPTPEEQLLYSRPAPPEEPAPVPATVIDSGRAADVLARIAWQLALPADRRARWLQDLLAVEQTCLVGANETARASSLVGAGSEWAYGLALPGQVVAYGREQIMGTAAQRECPVCGRSAAVVYDVG